ncbi:MAG: thiamine phosphate synthase, partial [Gemmatimonadetes bacterium]
ADAGPPLGAGGFARLARLAPDGVPVIGIGGVTAGNAASLMSAGAAGVAVIGAVWTATDPGAAARALRAALA